MKTAVRKSACRSHPGIISIALSRRFIPVVCGDTAGCCLSFLCPTPDQLHPKVDVFANLAERTRGTWLACPFHGVSNMLTRAPRLRVANAKLLSCGVHSSSQFPGRWIECPRVIVRQTTCGGPRRLDRILQFSRIRTGLSHGLFGPVSPQVVLATLESGGVRSFIARVCC